MEKQDVIKMRIKETNSKKTDSAIYGTLGGVTDYFPLEKFKINVKGLDQVELGKVIHLLLEELEKKEKKIQTLKRAIERSYERLEVVEMLLKKQGLL